MRPRTGRDRTDHEEPRHEAGNRPRIAHPENCTVIFIDHQPQMTFGVTSIDRQTLINNTVGLAKAAKVFDVPVILTTVETKSFSGYMWPQIAELSPASSPSSAPA